TGVSIEHAAAIVTIIPEDRSNVDVTIAGGSRLPAPAVRVQGDDLVIDGGLRNRVRGCTSRLGSAPRVRIAGVGVVSRDELPRIPVRAPRTLDLAIGGAVFADIGASAGGRVTLNGCGDTSMEAAAGQLHLTLNGSGDVEASRVGGPLTAA